MVKMAEAVLKVVGYVSLFVVSHMKAAVSLPMKHSYELLGIKSSTCTLSSKATPRMNVLSNQHSSNAGRALLTQFSQLAPPP